MPEERLTLKEMCERFNVTPRTLRHYEYIELLAPEREGRTRYFGPREIVRMEFILRGRRFGFSLEEIRQWLNLYDIDPTTRLQKEKLLEMSERQLEELVSRRRQLEEAIRELRELRNQTRRDLEAMKRADREAQEKREAAPEKAPEG